MVAIKTRVSGAWVDSTLEAKARIGGVWVDYGPPAGADETISLPSPPATLDANDGSQNYNMGLEFTVGAAVDGLGVEWYVPSSLATPAGGVYAAALWDVDLLSRIAYVEFTPTVSTKQRVLFGAPVALAPGNYIACVYTNHYVFTAGPIAGITSPSGNLVTVNGRLASYNGGAAGAPIPLDNTTTNFHIAPITTLP